MVQYALAQLELYNYPEFQISDIQLKQDGAIDAERKDW